MFSCYSPITRQYIRAVAVDENNFRAQRRARANGSITQDIRPSPNGHSASAFITLATGLR